MLLQSHGHVQTLLVTVDGDDVPDSSMNDNSRRFNQSPKVYVHVADVEIPVRHFSRHKPEYLSTLEGLSVVVSRNVLAELHDRSGSFVAKLNGNISEGIALVLVNIRAAYPDLLRLLRL